MGDLSCLPYSSAGLNSSSWGWKPPCFLQTGPHPWQGTQLQSNSTEKSLKKTLPSRKWGKTLCPTHSMRIASSIPKDVLNLLAVLLPLGTQVSPAPRKNAPKTRIAGMG